jgi:hypothetical protein
VARPLFAWRAFLPQESSGEIVLAQVELTKTCDKITQIDTGVRRYVGGAAAAKVRQYAIEGTRDVDENNPQRVYFHIRGRQPNAVVLYLRAEKLSTLYYTELGQHLHSVTIAFQDHVFPEHSHSLTGASTEDSGAHGHVMSANMGDFLPLVGNRFDAFAFTYRPGNPNPNAGAQHDIWLRHTETPLMDHLALGISFGGGGHQHNFPQDKSTGPYPQKALPHVATGNSSPNTGGAGVTAAPAHSGEPITFCDGLQVFLGKDNTQTPDDFTEAILGQLHDAGHLDWDGVPALGDGLENHVLVQRGTGAIRLDFLPNVSFTEGEYFIQLQVPAGTATKPNGGRILYNLYVE